MTNPPGSDPSNARAPVPALPPAARDRVVEILTQRFVSDELTQEDLEARLERVYAATTQADLDAVTADLPVAITPVTAAPSATLAAPGLTMSAVLSGNERKVVGTVPSSVELRARLGYVELDLRRAQFTAGVTTIRADAALGYIQIRLPAGVRVESEGRAILGYFAVKGEQPGNASVVVRVTGRAILGYAECFVSSRRPELPDADPSPRLERPKR